MTAQADIQATRRGRRPLGDRPMTAAERQRRSRDRLRFPAQGYSGKQIEVMLSGDEHRALDDLRMLFRDKSQKEIVELALLQLAQAYKAQITAKLGAMEHEVQESDGGRCDRQNPLR